MQILGPSLGCADSLCLEGVLGIWVFFFFSSLGSSGDTDTAIWKPVLQICTPSSPDQFLGILLPGLMP